MATAFQENAFQTVDLAWQIDIPTGPADVYNWLEIGRRARLAYLGITTRYSR